MLYDQTDGPGSLYVPAWHATDGNQARDTEAADDFVVPAQASGWTVRRLYIPGVLFGATSQIPGDALQSVNVRIYKDRAGAPDNQIAAEMNVSPTVNDQGKLTIDLPKPVDLRPGSYWLSVQGNLALAQGYYWNWRFRSTTSYAPAMLRNPANGLGLSCVSWSRIKSCEKNAAAPTTSDPDLLFRIEGTTALASADHTVAYILGFVAAVMATIGACGWFLRRKMFAHKTSAS